MSMPFFSEYRPPKYRRPAKVRIVKKPSKVNTVARNLRNLRRIVKNEKKTREVLNASGTIPESGVIHDLTAIPIGDDFNQRTGRSILLKSIQIKLFMRGPIVDPIIRNSVIRVIIFQDKMNSDGTNPTIRGTTTAVLQSTADGVGTTFRLRNPNPNAMARFKILYDKTHMMNWDSSNFTRSLNIYKKFSSRVVYNSNLDTSAAKNSVWMILISDGGTTLPTCLRNVRTRYFDS